MPKLSLTKEQKKQAESYMKTYKTNKKLLRMEKYHKAYMGGDNTEHMAEAEKEMLNETPFARARMFDVRHFILSLDNGDEKLLLYYHYIKGESVERCAELLVEAGAALVLLVAVEKTKNDVPRPTEDAAPR